MSTLNDDDLFVYQEAATGNTGAVANNNRSSLEDDDLFVVYRPSTGLNYKVLSSDVGGGGNSGEGIIGDITISFPTADYAFASAPAYVTFSAYTGEHSYAQTIVVTSKSADFDDATDQAIQIIEDESVTQVNLDGLLLDETYYVKVGYVDQLGYVLFSEPVKFTAPPGLSYYQWSASGTINMTQFDYVQRVDWIRIGTGRPGNKSGSCLNPGQNYAWGGGGGSRGDLFYGTHEIGAPGASLSPYAFNNTGKPPQAPADSETEYVMSVGPDALAGAPVDVQNQWVEWNIEGAAPGASGARPNPDYAPGGGGGAGGLRFRRSDPSIAPGDVLGGCGGNGAKGSDDVCKDRPSGYKCHYGGAGGQGGCGNGAGGGGVGGRAENFGSWGGNYCGNAGNGVAGTCMVKVTYA